MNQKTNPIVHIPLINYLTWKRAVINRFQSKKFIISIQDTEKRIKILQILFGQDGSLYIGFPYFKVNNGIISIGTLSEISSKTKLELEELGKVTTNKVKFAYHPDGEVHFSQTGKVKTEIRKKTLPLKDADGHIFSIYAQGYDHFEEDKKSSNIPPGINRTELSFTFEKKITNPIKIVGRWNEIRSFMDGTIGSSFGPIANGQLPNGTRIKLFLIGPPETYPHRDFILSIECEEIPLLDKSRNAVMFFIGGFGKPKERVLYQKETFLCALYPIIDIDEIERRIGSIDMK